MNGMQKGLVIPAVFNSRRLVKQGSILIFGLQHTSTWIPAFAETLLNSASWSMTG